MTENIEMNLENTESDELSTAPAVESAEECGEPERIVIFEEALEAILFAAGHPISYATLARVFEMTPAKIKDKVFEYSIKYNDSPLSRGVILLTYNDSCQLCTKQHYLPEIREALGIKSSGTLSSSAMEALAIVAYNQPVTRMFVDTLRRADSSYVIGSLLDRGLIEAKGRLDAPGRPILYGTTPDFLRSFGIKSLDELPSTSDELIAVFEKTKLKEAGASNQGASSEAPIIDPSLGVQLSITEAVESVIDESSADEGVTNDY